jgi:hypothetical protein
MATTNDNTGTASTTAAVATLSVTFTVSASATAIWAGLETDVATSAVTCVYDPTGVNQSFTAIGSAIGGGGQHIYAFGLVNPGASGSRVVKFSWTTSSRGACGVQSYLGTATTSVANTFYNNNTATGATGTTAPVVITSQTGDLVVGLVCADNTISSVSGTQIWLDNAQSDDGGHYTTGAATVTLTAGVLSGSNWAHQGCSVRQSTAVSLPPGGRSFDTPQPDRNTNTYNPQLRHWQAAARFLLIGQDQFPPGVMPGNPVYQPPPAWLVPERWAQWRSWTWSYNLNLIGKDQFPPGIFPGNPVYQPPPAWLAPERWAQWRSFAWQYNPLLHVVAQPPGVQLDETPAAWLVPERFAQWRTWTWSYNLNLIGQDQLPPGSIWDRLVPAWFFTDPFARWRSWTGSYNLNLIGKDQLPTGDQTNYLPVGNAWRPESPQQNILATILAVVPALPPGKQVWELSPRAADPFAQWRSWTGSYNPNLIGQDAFPVGAQWDDASPRAAQRGIDFQAQNLLPTLLSVIAQLPPGSQLYERPRFFFLM